MTTSVDLDKELLRRTVASILDVEVAEVKDSTHFLDDLEVDSLMALEVVVVLEKTYRVRIDESELREVTTLDKVCELLARKLGAA